MLLAVGLSFSDRAAADPVTAGKMMQVIVLDRQALDIHLQFAKRQARNGDMAGARAGFISAQMQATLLNLDLARMHRENQVSLDRGRYRDRAALLRAVQHGRVASLNIQVAAMDVQALVQTPASVPKLAQLNLDIDLFNQEMDRLEQAMREA
ncbi:MAG: hypothetical protein ACREP7_08895 [Lysobacter sp.]